MGGRQIRLLALLLSVFSSQMQALSQGLWVLRAEMGVAWHILGAGGFRAVALYTNISLSLKRGKWLVFANQATYINFCKIKHGIHTHYTQHMSTHTHTCPHTHTHAHAHAHAHAHTHAHAHAHTHTHTHRCLPRVHVIRLSVSGTVEPHPPKHVCSPLMHMTLMSM